LERVARLVLRGEKELAVKKRVGILISGRGSNMMALVEAARAPDYPAEVVAIISNRPKAPGIAWAEAQGLPTWVIDHKSFPSREAFDEAVDAQLTQTRVDLVALAGFMRIQSVGFVRKWLGRQLNIHPALLPLFRGLHPHKQALDAGVRISGCTVHFVTEETDSGPIVAQASVPVLDTDTPESLEARVLAAEHRLYPYALALVASGRARIEGNRVRIAAAGQADGCLLSPQP
jgi:phosphoribosylglycinamide formyltransferase 1